MTANCRSKNTADGVTRSLWIAGVMYLACVAPSFAQVPQPSPSPQSTKPAAAPVVAGPAVPAVPPGYVIGPDDVLAVVYWKDKDMSAEYRVRPDGRIALPLINEVEAAGLTPDELQKKITEESKKYLEDANITIVVREINSRRLFITGEVNKPGVYPLTSPTTVMQLISLAGGLREYANSKNITIMRTDGGKQISLKFNYKEVAAGKNLRQNIELKPGDTVVVP